MLDYIKKLGVVGAATIVIIGPAASVTWLASPVAAAATCSGNTTTYNNGGEDNVWSNSANWTNGAPGANDIAIIPGGIGPMVTASADVCDVQVGVNSSLDVSAGQALTAQSMEVAGQTNPTMNPTGLQGDFVVGSLEMQAGVTDYSSADSEPTIDAIHVTSSFTEDAGADFTLPDNFAALDVAGTATLGGPSGVAQLDGNSSCDCDGSPAFNFDGSVVLAGTVTSSALDLGPLNSSDINLAGHTWTLTADSFARFLPGTQVSSTPAGGTLNISSSYHLLLNGTTSIGSGATLALSPGATLSDNKWFANNGTTGALIGPGTFNWRGGQIVGDITLEHGLTTTLTGRAERHIADPTFGKSLLINDGVFTMSGGSLVNDDAPDTFANEGQVRVTGGSIESNSSDAPPYLNERGATWTVTPGSGTTSKLSPGSFTNSGTLVIAPKVHLTVGNVFKQTSTGTTDETISSPTVHSEIHAGTLKLGGTLHLASATGYKPARPVSVPKVLAAVNRAGKFAKVTSKTHHPKTKWTVTYAAKSVTAKLRKT